MYVCIYVLYVCIYVLYVCIYVLYVCMYVCIYIYDISSLRFNQLLYCVSSKMYILYLIVTEIIINFNCYGLTETK